MITSFKGKYRFLSNFYNCEIKYLGYTYPNSEAAFQAQKFSDEKDKLKIARMKNPLSAKRKGLEADLPKNWDELSIKHMRDILEIKFKDPVLAEKLKETKPEVLVENNYWHDNKWGSCTCEQCKNIEKQNLLGNILMEIRDSL